MSPEIASLLARHYGYDRRALARHGPLTTEEQQRLASAGHPSDIQTTFVHDEAVARLRLAAARLRESDVALAFLAGLTSGHRRGRQPLVSFAYARHLPDHAGQPNANGICLACGLPATDALDVTHERLRLHLGWAWNELPLHYLVDLESFDPAAIPQDAMRQGRAILTALLRFIEEQPPDTTPGALERAIAGAKLLPETDKYKRLGILIGLAEAGILPNPLLPPSWRAFVTPPERWDASRGLKGSPRSDITLPLAAWRGEQGVDWAMAEELFGVSRPGA